MDHIDRMTKMMAGSLGLEEPWYIVGAEFDEKELTLHIHVGIRKAAAIACPNCGGQTSRNGYEPQERVWRHGDVMFYPCLVHCRRPKVVCPHCGSVQVNAPFERKNSRFTLLFEGYAMLILADMPIAKTAGLLRCNEKSLVKVMRYWVNKAVDSMELKDVALLSIDETSFKRGHKYVTLIIDAAKRRVLDVEEGRDKETVKRFANKLLAKGGDPEQVTAVTSDMSKAFLPAIAEHFPNAKNVIDKFHVKKVLIDALDTVRKTEQKSVSDKKELFMGRRLFMVPQAKLSREQNVKLAEMSKRYPQTGRAYRIVASFDDFYASQTMEEANRNFDSLYSWMRRCRLEPMKEAAQTLKRYKDKILAYFKDRITNAICEGINSMIQATKRKARGFRTVEGYATMIYLVAGKLELAVPNPF
ncbi:MAG: transposase [Clostridiales bacterium]|jgi:transposase|nr:transposase [Clostridiales bacterium]